MNSTSQRQRPRRPRICFVNAIPLKNGPQRYKNTILRKSPKCALSPNIVRVGAVTLIAAGTSLRINGQHIIGRLFGLSALAMTSMMIMKGTRSNSPSPTPTGRFSGSRAAWDSSDNIDDDSTTAAPTSGLTRGMLKVARTLLTELLVPLLDALRLLIADIRTQRRNRNNTNYFTTAPPPPKTVPNNNTTWSWQSTSSSPPQQGQTGENLSVEERQIRAVQETARRAAESARGGAQKARNALRNLLDGFT